MKAEIMGMKEGTECHDSDMAIDWGVAAVMLPGQTESGDQFLIKPFEDGVLIAVIDGLGHGSEAAASAKAAVSTLEAHAHEPVNSLINLCHEKLRTTRGAVISLASLNTKENTITWIAVGNVVAVLKHSDAQAVRSHEYIFMGSGVVGDQLPVLRSSVLPIVKGDILVLATDGIRETFAGDTSLWRDPQRVADSIIARYAKGTDEGLVLVVRYKGGRQ